VTDQFDLTGKVAIVTGGSRGLGYEMAKGLAARGADLLVTSRKTADCEAVALEIRSMGRRALAYGCHVGHWNELPGLVDAAYAHFGKVDILVNNAGIAPTAPSALDVTEDLFDKTVAVNFKGPFRLCALVGARMAERGSGVIVNISSTASIRPVPAYPVYAGAKAALNVITKSFAFALGPKVRVNAIMCGPFWTDISKSWREEADKNCPSALRRIGRPHEIVTSLIYLVSDHSSFTTGTILELDGGLP
jgi:NAD(P)-dependent dehydrogenase (short-subunit alcohol dehydrogenase family)